MHRLQGARHQRAARRRSVKERLLVDLLRPVGVADEDDFDVAIAPLQKHVEQHVEALGQVLHVLRHRAGNVHQTEHHGLRHRLWHGFETAIPDIDRIDVGNPAGLCLEGLELGDQFSAACFVALRKLRFQLLNRCQPRPPQRDATRQRAARGAADRNIRRRAGSRITGPLDAFTLRFGQFPLGEVRQLQVVEEQVDEFVPAQHEPKRIFAVAFARIARLAAAFFAGTRQDVTFDELLVSRKHHVARAALAAKARLIHAVERNADLSALQHILDVAVLRRFLDRTSNKRFGTTQEPLTILKTLAARIEPPVNDVHDHRCIRLLSRLASRACTIRPACEPDARYSRARPSARRSRRASSRCRRPSSCRTRSPEAGLRPARISAFR